jgi:hypothetical protein
VFEESGNSTTTSRANSIRSDVSLTIRRARCPKSVKFAIVLIGSFGHFRIAEVGRPISFSRLLGLTWEMLMVSRQEARDLLGITTSATEAEVRAAFRRKLIENHPDTAMPGVDESIVQQLIDAYHLLAKTDLPTFPGAPAQDSGEPSTGRHRIRVEHKPTAESDASIPRRRRCPLCRGTGIAREMTTCPDCRGGSLLTTLDIDRVRVATCSRCRGLGRVRAMERCGACDGSGVHHI